jgi:formylglycine-generating enzyme required for sulfatase activity
MHDNDWEWVEECYQPTYEDAPTDASAVKRGGNNWVAGLAHNVGRRGKVSYSPTRSAVYKRLVFASEGFLQL